MNKEEEKMDKGDWVVLIILIVLLAIPYYLFSEASSRMDRLDEKTSDTGQDVFRLQAELGRHKAEHSCEKLGGEYDYRFYNDGLGPRVEECRVGDKTYLYWASRWSREERLNEN